jgi:hypothetical protein
MFALGPLPCSKRRVVIIGQSWSLGRCVERHDDSTRGISCGFPNDSGRGLLRVQLEVQQVSIRDATKASPTTN